MKKITNYKIQITNKLQITNYNVQNYMPDGIHASMHSCNHATMQYHSHSPLFPIFLSSQLPIFPLYPLAAGGKNYFLKFFINPAEDITAVIVVITAAV